MIFICDHGNNGCPKLDMWLKYEVEHPEINCNYMVFVYTYNTWNILLNRKKLLRMFYNKLQKYGMQNFHVEIADICPAFMSMCACGLQIEPVKCNVDDLV